MSSMQSQPARQTRSMLFSSKSLKIGFEKSAALEKDLRSTMWAGIEALAARSRARMLGREAMTMLMRASRDLEAMRSMRFCSVVPEPEARTARFMGEKITEGFTQGTHFWSTKCTKGTKNLMREWGASAAKRCSRWMDDEKTIIRT